MRMTFESVNDLCILHLAGRFVTGSDSDYRRARNALENKGFRSVVVDCRELPCLDSTGISFVVGLYKMFADQRGQFLMVDINSRVKEVLKITHLDKFIPAFEGLPQALAVLEPVARAAGSETLRAMPVSA